MDITTVLAQVWGPIMIALGLGFLFNRSFYARVYRDLEKAPFAVIVFGMVAIAAGIFQIRAHNIWETAPQILISFFGWGLLFKGIVCTVFPRMADRGGDWALQAKLVPAIGWIVLLLGAYLSWVGYYA